MPEQMGIKSLSKLVDISIYTAHVRGLGAGCRCDQGAILKQLPEITRSSPSHIRKLLPTYSVKNRFSVQNCSVRQFFLRTSIPICNANEIHLKSLQHLTSDKNVAKMWC